MIEAVHTFLDALLLLRKTLSLTKSIVKTCEENETTKSENLSEDSDG